MFRPSLTAWLCGIALAGAASAADGPAPDRTAAIRTAVERGLPLVQGAAKRYPSHRQCFSCHHQTLPMLAMVTARGHGFAIDEDLLQDQADFTLDSFRTHLADLKKGEGIGGKAMTVSYGLWALELAGRAADDVTEAMVTYLIKTQEADGHWPTHTRRLPMEESVITCAGLSVRGLERYATSAQRTDAESCIRKAKEWLATAPRKTQEDRIAWLWALHRLRMDAALVEEARSAVLAAQRDDGGWAQDANLASDAYATGQTLHVLRATGLERTHPAFVRGVAFLLKTQLDDGSWRVETRSKPVQVYFDNGDPHGKHQFISTPATSWAVGALAAALEQP